MKNYMKRPDLPPRYDKIVTRYGDGLGDFVGPFGGLFVTCGSHEVSNPSTNEIIGYSTYIDISHCSDLTFSPHPYSTKNLDPEDGVRLVEKERAMTVPQDLGFAALKTFFWMNAASLAADGFNVFDSVDRPVVGGIAAVTAIGSLGTFIFKQRRKRTKEFKRFVKGLSRELSDSKKTRIGCDLFAPDSVVYDDAATGTSDNRRSSNDYFIGSVPIDQEDRAKHFWQKANKILEEAGFEEWQSEKPSMVALVKNILEDVQKKPYFNDVGMGDIVESVHYFSLNREEKICEVQKIDELLKIVETRQKNGVGIADIDADNNYQIKILAAAGWGSQELDREVMEVLEIIDKKHTEDFQTFVEELRRIIVHMKALYNEDTLLKMYKCYSETQKFFWEELGRVLAENNIDPLYLDETSLEMVQFVSQIPEMCATNEGALSDNLEEICELYRSFHERFSVKFSSMSSPGSFIDRVVKKRDRDRRYERMWRGVCPAVLPDRLDPKASRKDSETTSVSKVLNIVRKRLEG